MNDTKPHIEQKMRELIQAKSPIERLQMGSSMHETSRNLIIWAIQKEYPSITPTALKQQIFLKFYGNDFTPTQCEKILKHLENC